MNQAQQYLVRFRQAETVQQQRAIAEEYRTFYNALPQSEQTKANEVMQVLWPEIDNEVAELEQLTHQVHQRLSKKVVRA